MTAAPDIPRDQREAGLGFRPDSNDAVAAIFLLVSLVLFMGPALFGGVYYLRDICQEIVPKRTWLVGSGWDFLWNPYMFLGLPEAANSQTSAFYPLNLIFFLGPVPRALSFYVAVHLAIALSFAYILPRALGRSPAASAFAAVSFAYGGFFVSLQNQVVVLDSATWIMPLLWAALMAFRTGGLAHVALAGTAWGLMVLGGEPEIAYLSGPVLLVFLAYLVLEGPGEDGWKRPAGRAGLVLGGALVVAVGLSAVQWLPSLELAGLSNRAGGLSLEDADKWHLDFKALVTLLVPNFIADPGAYRDWALGYRNDELPYLLSIYPGLVATMAVIAAALLAAAGRPRGRLEARPGPLLLGLGALVFLALSLGRRGGLYVALHQLLPGFDRFRVPERCLFGFAVLFALLAALAADFLFARWEAFGKRLAGGGRRPALRAAFIVAAGASLAGLAALARLTPPIAAGAEEYFRIHLWLLGLASSRSLLALAAAAALVGLGALGGEASRRRLAAGLAAVLFLDLYVAHRHVAPVTSPDFYALAGNAVEGLDAPPGTRVWTADPDRPEDRTIGAGRDAREFFRRKRLSLQAFSGLELGVRQVNARSSFYPADVDLWFKLLGQGGQDGARRLLELSGVKWALRAGSAPIKLDAALPRVFVSPSGRWVPDRDTALKETLGGGFDPTQEVILEGPPPAAPPVPEGNLFWPMRVLEEDNDQVVIVLEEDHPGYLVLLDLYYPGWEARVNGEPAPIIRANGFFRAVEVGAEGAVVEFLYRPRGFYAGLIVSLAFAAGCVVAWSRGRREWFWLAGLLVIYVVLPLDEGGTTNLPVAAMRIAVLALAATWPFRLRAGGEDRWYRTRLDPWLFGFWALASVSLVRSHYFFISSYWLIQIVTYLLLFFFLVQFTGGTDAGARRRRGWLWGLIVAAALLQAGWAVVQSTQNTMLLAAGLGKNQFRATGGYFNPAMLAGALMAVGPGLLARALLPSGTGSAKRAKALLAVAGLLIVTGGLIATRSRAMAILPVALALVAVPVLASRFERRGLTRGRALGWASGLTAAAAAAAILLFTLIPNPIQTRLLQLERDPYAFQRFKLWRCGLEVAADHPLGVGLGMFKYYSNRHRFPVEGVMAGRYEKNPETAHNEYIHLAAELSSLGPALLLVPLGLLLWRTARVTLAGRPAREAERLGPAAGLLAIALHSLFDSNLHEPGIAALAVALAALLWAELCEHEADFGVRAKPTGSGLWVIRVVLVALLLIGGPWLLRQAGSLEASLKAMEERDLAIKERRLTRLVPAVGGYAVHFRELANTRWSLFMETRNGLLLDEAIKAAEAAIAANPEDPSSHRQRGQYLLSLNVASKDGAALAASRRSFEDAYALSPRDLDVAIGLALVSRFEKQAGAELDWWRVAVDLEPYDLMSRVYLARALYEAGRIDEAMAALQDFDRARGEVAEMTAKRPNAFASIYRGKRTRINEADVLAVEDAVKTAVQAQKQGAAAQPGAGSGAPRLEAPAGPD